MSPCRKYLTKLVLSWLCRLCWRVWSGHETLTRLQQELNTRFLQDRGLLPVTSSLTVQAPASPAAFTLHTEMHQHQHQHLHHHQHHLLTSPSTASLDPVCMSSDVLSFNIRAFVNTMFHFMVEFCMKSRFSLVRRFVLFCHFPENYECFRLPCEEHETAIKPTRNLFLFEYHGVHGKLVGFIPLIRLTFAMHGHQADWYSQQKDESLTVAVICFEVSAYQRIKPLKI